ncbi:MAG: hypothetical protein JXB39_04340, partial [Deltaproteobacteria bacterium]|nr:hypothetical protein [Deltaproteobacteria bacterium]
PQETFCFEAADLEALRAAGLGPVILNAEHFPLVERHRIRPLKRLFMGLFGKPRARMARAWAWDATTWTGATCLPVLPFEPTTPELAGVVERSLVDAPIALRSPASEVFVLPRTGFDAPSPEDGARGERQ